MEQLIFALSCTLNIYKKQSIVGQFLFLVLMLVLREIFSSTDRCFSIFNFLFELVKLMFNYSVLPFRIFYFVVFRINVPDRVNLWKSRLSSDFVLTSMRYSSYTYIFGYIYVCFF